EGALQTVQGEVVELNGRELTDGRTIVTVVLHDGSQHCVEGVWFNQPYAARPFRYGLRVAFSGKPKWFRDRWQMNNPRVAMLGGSAGRSDTAADRPTVIPVYPLTEDLRTEHLRPILRRLVDQYAGLVTEIIPQQLRSTHNFPGVTEGLRAVHFPSFLAEAETARRRFLYER